VGKIKDGLKNITLQQRDIIKEKEDLITIVSGMNPPLEHIIKNWKLDEEFARQVFVVQGQVKFKTYYYQYIR